MGPFDYDFPNGSRPNLSMEIKRYKTAEVFAFNKSYYFSPEMITGMYCTVYVLCVRARVCAMFLFCTYNIHVFCIYC